MIDTDTMVVSHTAPADEVTETGGSFDLRLAVVAVGVWGAAIATLYTGWIVGAVLAAVAAGVGWGVRRRQASSAVVLCALTIGIFAGAAVCAVQVASRDAGAVTKLWEAKTPVDVTATVTDDPVPLTNGTQPRLLIPVSLDSVTTAQHRIALSEDAIVFAADEDGTGGLLPGQQVKVVGAAGQPRGGDLTALTVFASETPQPIGQPPWWQVVAGDLRAGLRAVCADLPAEPGGLLPGLALGDRSTMDPGVAEDFQATGMTHLLAVSGANVTLITGAVVLLATACGANRRVRTVCGIAAIIAFVVLVRPSPSVLRAAVMGGVGLLAVSRRGPASAVPALSTAVIVLVLADPSLATDLGFGLSVLACAGLIFFASGWARAWQRRGWPRWLATAVAVPAAAQLAVTPMLAAVTGEITPIAVPVNAVAAIAVPPATVLTVLATLAAAVWTPAAAALVWLASWPAWWLVEVARYGAGVPAGTLSWPAGVWPAIGLAGLLVVMLWMLTRRRGRLLLLVLVLGVTVGVAPVRLWVGGWPPPGWVMVACDVGQGDGLVLATGDPRAAVVVDAGPQPQLINECLRGLGVTHVPLLVISHYHADHVAGVSGVYRNREVGKVIAPADPDPRAGHRKLTEAADSRPVAVGVGNTIEVGETTVEVLSGARRFLGTRSDANNNSVVLRAEVDDVSILLPGDLEEPAQRELLAAGPKLAVDVLKVPHHGSGHFVPEFFNATKARIAVVSAGDPNDYGHPHARTLRQLRGQGATVSRTDRDASIAVVRTDNGLALAHNG